MPIPSLSPWLVWLLVAALSAIATILALLPTIRWLRKRALALPNARSGHSAPTPQGAGLVVVPVFLLASAAGASAGALPSGAGALHVWGVAAAAVVLMLVGFRDDTKPMPVLPRLLAQSAAVLLVLLTLPAAMRAAPFLPLVLERTLLFLALMWLVNLTNFMDGMDGLSVVEAGGVTLGIVLLAALGLAPGGLGWPAAALFGAMLGFAAFNAPPARVFLGDAGSLPLGLLLGTLLLHLATTGAWAAAAILPLYYLADATITLARRIWRRERVWEAHRQHFYQQALRSGWSVPRVLTHVAGLNVILVGLATVAAAAQQGAGRAWIPPLTLAVALAVVVAALARMARHKVVARSPSRRHG